MTRTDQSPNAQERNILTTKPFRILVAMVVLLCGGLLVFNVLKENTTLSFSFLLDGKPLSVGIAPKVQVDGQPFTSGCTLAPGSHTLTAELQMAEPLERRVWVLFGDKNLGALPFESSKGSLLVSVNPSPASVIVRRGIEMVGKGDAPLTLETLSFGNYELEIKRGEHKETHPVKIQGKPRTEANIELNLGSVSLSSDPADADFDLSGNGRHWRGKLPMHIDEVPAGVYSVVIHRREYEERHSINIQRRQLTETNIQLNLGSVSLSSDPADAEFDLSGNGRHWQGKLPRRIDEVPVGKYSLLTRRKGWDLNAVVVVARGGIATNKTEFQYGSISVTGNPSSFVISTNGVTIGNTPTVLRELKPGQYTLTATDGEGDQTAEIAVRPKEETKHAFVFHYGAAQIASTPSGAAVSRNGKQIGKTPLTLSRLPVGEAILALNLAGYVPTNLTVHVTEKATTNLIIKLSSERYLEAMRHARTAFDSGQFAEASKFVTVALESQTGDTLAIRLRDEIIQAEKNADKARMEAEERVKKARMEAEERANRVKDEARRREFAEQAVQKRKAFDNVLSKTPENEFFEIHTREFPYSFETVWQAATNIMRRKDKDAVGDATTGVLRQKNLYSAKKGGVLGALLGPGDDRSHWMLITPVDREITRVELKLFNYELVDSPNDYARFKTEQGQPFKFIRISIFIFGLVLDKDLVRSRAAELFDEIEKALPRPNVIEPVQPPSRTELAPSVAAAQSPPVPENRTEETSPSRLGRKAVVKLVKTEPEFRLSSRNSPARQRQIRATN